MSTTINFDSAGIQHDNQVLNQEPYEGDEMSTAVQPETETALTIPSDLHITKAPKEVLDSAREAAMALKEVIAHKKRPVVFNGEQYLQFEDWQTVGGFFGSSVATGDAELVEIDGVPGFKAKARVIDSNGIEVSTAEAYCMKDEYNWKGKPFFQLASMAQTRAGAKALRNKFAWVAVLAGYSPTPAEEMTGDESDSQSAVECPLCQGPMWDNRISKRNPKAPDYKCKDQSCNGAIWLKAGEESAPTPSPRKRINETRKTLIASVAQAFKLLNELGYQPPWTKKLAHEFVALHFQGAASVDDLEDDQVSDLLRMLSEKVDALKHGNGDRKNDLIASIKSHFDTEQHLANYLKDYGGKPLSELPIAELEAMLNDLEIPF